MTQHTKHTPPILRGLKILTLLQWGRHYTALELARELGVETRTISRDVRALRAAGFDIKSTTGLYGSFWLETGEVIRPVLFDDSEARLTLMALKTLAAATATADPNFQEIFYLSKRFEKLLPEAVRASVHEEFHEVERRVLMGAAMLSAHEKRKQDAARPVTVD